MRPPLRFPGKSMTAPELPRVGITMGDPAGVGPEIVVKALAHEELYHVCRPVVLAHPPVMQHAIEVAGVPLLLRCLEELRDARFRPGTLEVLDVTEGSRRRDMRLESIVPGKPSETAARTAVHCLERAMEMVRNRALDAVAAAPLASLALQTAGYQQATQTELMADLAGSKLRVPMLIAGDLRVASVTGCSMLRQALDQVRKPRVFAAIRLTHQCLQALGISSPRIGVAALNPCPQSPQAGSAEADEIIPAIEDSRREREPVDAQGPFSAEELLRRLSEGLLDAALVMYHDQGFPAAKTLSSRLATAAKVQPTVVVVIGLPAACTAVDHDPQFESAGKGIAGEESMVEAVHLAARLAAGSWSRRRSAM